MLQKYLRASQERNAWHPELISVSPAGCQAFFIRGPHDEFKE